MWQAMGEIGVAISAHLDSGEVSSASSYAYDKYLWIYTPSNVWVLLGWLIMQASMEGCGQATAIDVLCCAIDIGPAGPASLIWKPVACVVLNDATSLDTHHMHHMHHTCCYHIVNCTYHLEIHMFLFHTTFHVTYPILRHMVPQDVTGHALESHFHIWMYRVIHASMCVINLMWRM